MVRSFAIVPLLLSLLLPDPAGAWSWQNPTPQGNRLLDIASPEPGTLVAVGHVGSIVRSTDSGASWDVQHTAGGVPGTMRGVSFADACTGWAAGNFVLLKTTDGGVTWAYALPFALDLHAVDFFDEDLGLLVGGTFGPSIVRTTDGGASWTSILGLGTVLRDVAFLDASTAVAVGDKIVRSTDAGATWADLGAFGTLRGVSFADSFTGTAVGAAGLTLRTTDRGATWTDQTFDAGLALEEVVQLSPSSAVAVGAGGVIRRTDDGGSTWAVQASGTTDDLYSVVAEAETVARGAAAGGGIPLFAVGDGGEMLGTVDGSNWMSLRMGAGGLSYQGVAFSSANSDRLLAVRQGGIDLSTDGGETWTTTYSALGSWNGVAYRSDVSIMAVASAAEDLARSTDGGQTWNLMNITTEAFQAYGVDYADALTAVIVGDGGRAFRTTDGGGTWTKVVDLLANPRFNGVKFKNPTTGLIVGNDGVILRTTDGGATWTDVPSGTTEDLYDVDLGSFDRGVIAGDNGVILTSLDCGQTWTVRPTGFPFPLYGAALDGDTGFTVVGDQGVVIVSDDFGQTIQGEDSGTERIIYDVADDGSGRRVAVGSHRTVIRDVPTRRLPLAASCDGTTEVELPEPLAPGTGLVLEPPQPNPFAGETSLRFSVARAGPVRLRVYDVAGRHVATVVDRALAAGPHVGTWTAPPAGGVYFAVVEAGGEREVRKLTVLR